MILDWRELDLEIWSLEGVAPENSTFQGYNTKKFKLGGSCHLSQILDSPLPLNHIRQL